MPARKKPLALPRCTGGKYSAIMVCPATWKKHPWKPDKTRMVMKISTVGATAAPIVNASSTEVHAMYAVLRPTI